MLYKIVRHVGLAGLGEQLRSGPFMDFLLRFSPRILRLNRAPAGVSPTTLALVSSCELLCEHRKGLALSACWDRTKHEVCLVPSLGIIMGWWGDVAPPSFQGKKKKYSSFGSKDPDGVCISPFTVATNIMRQTGRIMKKQDWGWG